MIIIRCQDQPFEANPKLLGAAIDSYCLFPSAPQQLQPFDLLPCRFVDGKGMPLQDGPKTNLLELVFPQHVTAN